MDKIFGKIKDLYKKCEDVIIPAAVLIIICVAVTLALSSTNLLTRGPIAEITAQNNRAAMEKVLKAESYTEWSSQTEDGAFTYNVATNGSETVGYIFITSAKGYGGDVGVMTAIGTDGKVIAVEILDVSNETPGLGQNATKPYFYEQFIGMTDKTQVVKNGADPAKSQIDALTGATITSRAVTNAVNEAIALSKDVINKGGEAQ